jgi:hypothetical protein
MKQLIFILLLLPYVGLSQQFFPSFYKGIDIPPDEPDTVILNSAVSGLTWCNAAFTAEADGDEVGVRGFVYDTSTNPTIENNAIYVGYGTGTFYGYPYSLTANTIYYVRAFIYVTDTFVYSSQLDFSTKSLPSLTATTGTITETSVYISGTITTNNNSHVTVRINYSENSDVSSPSYFYPQISGTSYSGTINNLSPNTTYYYRAFTTTTCGDGNFTTIRSFTTDDITITAPMVVTCTTPVSVTDTTAQLCGNVLSNGGSPIVGYSIEYGTDGVNFPYSVNGEGPIADFTALLENLTPSTTYYYKAFAANEEGLEGWGGIESVTTQQIAATVPTIETYPVTDIMAESATGNAIILSSGGASITARGFCYNTTGNPTTSDSKTTGGTSTGTFSHSISSLSDNTTYYVKAYATNSEGTAYGNQVSFTTYENAVPTVLSCAAPTFINDTSATICGEVTDNGGSDILGFGFKYGLSSGNLNLTANAIGSESNFYADLFNLTAGTTYYYRAVATNDSGEGLGAIYSFTTSQPQPTNFCLVKVGEKYVGQSSANPNFIHIKPDGTKLFLLDGYSTEILEFLMTTPNDITTLDYNTYTDFGTSVGAFGMRISSDGDMYYWGKAESSKKIYQYELPSSWSVDSITSLQGQYTMPLNYDQFSLNSSETKLYMIKQYINGYDNTFEIYSLTAGDITTMSLTGSVPSPLARSHRFTFNDNGTKIFILNLNKEVFRFSLSTPYDISTATMDGTEGAVIDSRIYNVIDMIYSNNYLYFVDNINVKIFQYRICN